MEDEKRDVLSAVQISSLWPSTQTGVVHIRSNYQTTPRSRVSERLAVDHAIAATIFTFQKTGDILLRVIDDGYVLELIPLHRRVHPVRYVFPSRILSTPSIGIWNHIQCRVIVLLEHGSIFRLAFPADGQLWKSTSSPDRSQQEYRIKQPVDTWSSNIVCLGCSGAVIGLLNGDLLRIEILKFGDAVHSDGTQFLTLPSVEHPNTQVIVTDEWSEWNSTVSSNLLSSLAAYIPFHQTSHVAQFVSIAAHQYPIDMSLVFTLSKNRLLRAWTAKAGCIAETQIPSSSRSRSILSSSNRAASDVELLSDSRTFIRVVSLEQTADSGTHLLLFVPEEHSVDRTGTFYIYSLSQSQDFLYLGSFNGPSNLNGELMDCLIRDRVIFTLWNMNGTSSLATIGFDEVTRDDSSDMMTDVWQISTYPLLGELDSLNLYQEAAEPEVESLNEYYMTNILHPERFSPATLQATLDQYIETTPTDRIITTPLETSGGSLFIEKSILMVVASTIEMTHDSNTGQPMRSHFQKTVRRDWESFTARCLAIERNGRQPVALSTSGQHSIVILERERTAVVFPEENCMSVQRKLRLGYRVTDPACFAIATSWLLRSKIELKTPYVAADIETQIRTLLQREPIGSYSYNIRQVECKEISGLNFSGPSPLFADIEADHALDPNVIMQSVKLLRHVGESVKSESIQVEDGLSSEWERSLSCSFTAAIIKARYELASCLAMLLFACSDMLNDSHDQVLASFLHVLRGLYALHAVTGSKPGSSIARDERQGDDSLVDYRGSTVGRAAFGSARCMLSNITINPDLHCSLVDTSNATLAATGLLDKSATLNHTSSSEIFFLNQLLFNRCFAVLDEIISMFPQSAPVTYVKAKVLLSQGRVEEAQNAFDVVAGQITSPDTLTLEDRSSFTVLLPQEDGLASLSSFYSHVADIFANCGEVLSVIYFTAQALEFTRSQQESHLLWQRIITCSAALGSFDQAFLALSESTLPKDLQRSLIDDLAETLCRQGTADLLFSTCFEIKSLRGAIRHSLEWKARNEDCLGNPHYSHILYSWHIRSGDFREAAIAMYEHACRLHGKQRGLLLSHNMLQLQVEAYQLAISALVLLGPKNAWMSIPTLGIGEPKNSRGDTFIPDNLFTDVTRDHCVIDVHQLRRECLKSKCMLELLLINPRIAEITYFPIPDDEILVSYLGIGHFDAALYLAATLGMELEGIFQKLARLCIDSDQGQKHSESTSIWLQSPRIGGRSGSLRDLAWSYLESALNQYDSAAQNYAYHITVVNALLSWIAPRGLPGSLLQVYAETMPIELLLQCLRHGYQLSAFPPNVNIAHNVRSPQQFLTSGPLLNSSYTQIVQVLYMVGGYPSGKKSNAPMTSSPKPSHSRLG